MLEDNARHGMPTQVADANDRLNGKSTAAGSATNTLTGHKNEG